MTFDQLQKLKDVPPMPTLFTREETVWLTAWAACCASSNCNEKSVAVSWADRCLKDFKDRFGDETKEKSS